MGSSSSWGLDNQEVQNQHPGKDIAPDDLRSKFPLVAKRSPDHISTFMVAGVKFGDGAVPIMAGPNLVESRELIFDVARSVKSAGAAFLRGGAFKPLTFPYRSASYRETREEGVAWLGEAKERFGIPVITEVMEERHLQAVAEVADIIQIGARNMQNYPFLTACARLGKPLMLKRHYGASLRDWLGAAEYLLIEGNGKVILCERGVVAPHTHRATSRYLLDLQVVPAAKEVTHLPIVVDPSHATFWAPWVTPLALAAVAAGADGLMIEVHPDPRNAAVDPLQPLDYAQFAKLARGVAAISRCR